MKIALSGYFGFKNTGDEAILLAMRDGIREILPETRISVLDQPNRFNLRMIADCDLLISGGGGLLQDKTSTRSFLYYLGIIRLAKLLGKKVFIFAQGIGPISKWYNRLLLKRVLNKVDLITVRDLNSFNFLKSLKLQNPKIVETADPTFVLTPEDGEKILKIEGLLDSKPRIGICLRKNQQSQKIAAVCKKLIEKLGAQIIFIPFQLPYDLSPSQDILNQIDKNACMIFREMHPREVLGVISRLDLLIGMRLHSLIFAVNSLVPAVGLSYDPKVASFMGEIDLPCIDIDDLEVENLLSAVLELWDNRTGVKHSLESHRRKLRAQSRLNFGLIRMLKGE